MPELVKLWHNFPFSVREREKKNLLLYSSCISKKKSGSEASENIYIKKLYKKIFQIRSNRSI